MSRNTPENDDTAQLINSERRQRLSRHNTPTGISPIIHEDDDRITIRRPVQYQSLNAPVSLGEEDDAASTSDHADSTRATIQRYKYYSRLAAHSGSQLLMPNHIVPSEFFLVLPFKPEPGTQHSIITIFSIWNTMMGTSLLSMPWALERAGFACGLTIMVVMAAVTLYTSYRVLKSTVGLEGDGVFEFTDICRIHMGRTGYFISIIFSLVALLGAAIVYWVLMSNFLYHTGQFIHDKLNPDNSSVPGIPINNTYGDVFCPNPPPPSPPTIAPPLTTVTPNESDVSQVYYYDTFEASTSTGIGFDQLWSQTHTVPFFLIIVLLPLVNFKSPTFFTKFNALGTVSVLYIFTFVIYKVSKWGFHLDFNPDHWDRPMYVPLFQWTFPALSGTLSLAFFIHNCVLSIMKNQKNPENNGRDLSIAFICVAVTYIFIGATFYTSFPLPKNCIEDNFLNNFRSSDIFAFTARIFLFFQMVTVFPLLLYLFRVQCMNALFQKVYPGLGHVLVMNVLIICLCLVFAVFLPQIGTIIRFSGALCGLAYIFTLPCVVYLLHLRKNGQLTWPLIVFHGLIILIGVANFAAQFTV